MHERTPQFLEIDKSTSLYEADNYFTLNFNKNMSVAAVFLDTEKAFDTTWHSGLLFSELGFLD
jgi:hypothetical protein